MGDVQTLSSMCMKMSSVNANQENGDQSHSKTLPLDSKAVITQINKMTRAGGIRRKEKLCMLMGT